MKKFSRLLLSVFWFFTSGQIAADPGPQSASQVPCQDVSCSCDAEIQRLAAQIIEKKYQDKRERALCSMLKIYLSIRGIGIYGDVKLKIKRKDVIGTFNKYLEYAQEIFFALLKVNPQKIENFIGDSKPKNMIEFVKVLMVLRAKLLDYYANGGINQALDDRAQVYDKSDMGRYETFKVLRDLFIVIPYVDPLFDVNPHWQRDIPRACAEIWFKNSLAEDAEKLAGEFVQRNEYVISEKVKKLLGRLPQSAKDILIMPEFIKNRPWLRDELKDAGKGFVRAFVDRAMLNCVHGVSDFAFGQPFSRQN